jgi:hypothetical protein
VDEKSWRDSVFVTPAKAAEIIGYSVGTVRNMIFSEALRAVRQSRGGPMFVTVESLIEHIEAAQPVSGDELARSAGDRRGQEPAKLKIIQGGRK